MSKALFYPSIDISSELWLKKAVLFWDEIQTIVPASIKNPYSLKCCSGLMEKGILKPQYISSDSAFVKGIEKETKDFLDRSESINILESYGSPELHIDKLPDYIASLFKANNRGFIRIDKSFSDFYLTLLANHICEKEKLALLTDDETSAGFSKVLLGKQISQKNKLQEANGMLMELTLEQINIPEGASFDHLLEFKKDNGDLLISFRQNLKKIISIPSEVANLEELKEYILDFYQTTFVPDYKKLQTGLNSLAKKSITETLLKLLVVSVPAIGLLPTTLGLDPNSVLFTVSSLTIAGQAYLYDTSKKDLLSQNYMSYLHKVNQTYL